MQSAMSKKNLFGELVADCCVLLNNYSSFFDGSQQDFCRRSMTRPRVADEGYACHIHRIPVSILKKQSLTIDKGWSFVLRVYKGLKPLHRKKVNMLQNNKLGRTEMHRRFRGKPKGKGPFGKSRRAWDDNIEMHIKEIGWEGEVMIWLMIWTSGRSLWTRSWTSGLHKMWRISCIAEETLTSQEGLWCMQLGI